MKEDIVQRILASKIITIVRGCSVKEWVQDGTWDLITDTPRRYMEVLASL